MNKPNEMNNPIDDGPAFPHPEFAADVVMSDGRKAARVYPPQSGMSLRDWFAGQALAGMQSSVACNWTNEQFAQEAYKQADAMLKARAAK